MPYPENRMRRLRKSDVVRRLVRDVRLSVNDLIVPMFVKSGANLKEPIDSLKDHFYFSPDTCVEEAEVMAKLGIPAVLIFGKPQTKDQVGSSAWAQDGPVQQAIAAIKKNVPEIAVFTDVCLCSYTSHSHCGVVIDGIIDNDKSCELIAKTALSLAQAGADGVAPSDMMDGRVAAIRQTLEHNKYHETIIMSYSAKYASAFYGPFRDVANSSPAFGDRKTYQMDPACNQALIEMRLDIEEGADIIMVKPAMCYLDVIAKAKQFLDAPVAAYNVSGEYMMVQAAAERGVLDADTTMMEILIGIKRAGADIIITYFAKRAAQTITGN